MGGVYSTEQRVVANLARIAGQAILEVYASRFEVRYKGPGDPVTDADLRAEEIIVSGLSREFPMMGSFPRNAGCRKRPVGKRASGMSIRSTAPRVCRAHGRVLRDHRIAGLRDEIAWIITGGQRRRTWVSAVALPNPLRLAVSRCHRHPMIDVVKSWLGVVTEFPCGSVGAKIGLLLSGQADAHVEPSPYTSKWDVCGAEAILRAAREVS